METGTSGGWALPPSLLSCLNSWSQLCDSSFWGVQCSWGDRRRWRPLSTLDLFAILGERVTRLLVRCNLLTAPLLCQSLLNALIISLWRLYHNYFIFFPAYNQGGDARIFGRCVCLCSPAGRMLRMSNGPAGAVIRRIPLGWLTGYNAAHPSRRLNHARGEAGRSLGGSQLGLGAASAGRSAGSGNDGKMERSGCKM